MFTFIVKFETNQNVLFIIQECVKTRNELNKTSLISMTHIDAYDLKELEDNKLIQQCIIDGMKHRNLADLLLDRLINYEETLIMDQVWDCIDLYRESILKTKDKDLELEAEILSNLGLIYADVLKMANRAKTYYYACFSLTESMKPKLFTSHTWYIRCCNAIKIYQKNVNLILRKILKTLIRKYKKP